MNSRRQFLKTTSAAALLVLPAVTIEGAPMSSGYVRYERFAALVGTEFSVSGEDGSTAKLTLIEAKAKTLEADFEEFSLRFSGSGIIALPQGTYQFKHKKIFAPLSMFIVPNAGGGGEQYYEAVFNRFLK